MTLTLILPAVVATWLGLCFGSFSNVLVYRLPRNLSIVRPGSACPACSVPVKWYDNIPILSWLILRGRCRHCSAPISPRYLLLELAGAACAWAGLLRFGWTVEGAAAAVFLLLLVNVAVIDWQHMIIPHTLTVTGMVVGLAVSPFTPLGPEAAILGLLVGGAIILAISWAYKLVRGVIGMGGGDIMLMAMVGAFLGPWGAVAVLFGGAFLGSIFALTAGRFALGKTAKLPFGTFLAGAAVVVLLAGEVILAWYLAQF